MEGVQAEAPRRVGEMGGVRVGLQQHAPGHVPLPRVHRPAEHPRVQPGWQRVRRHGEAVRARSHDRHVDHRGSHVLLLRCLGDRVIRSKPRFTVRPPMATKGRRSSGESQASSSLEHSARRQPGPAASRS